MLCSVNTNITGRRLSSCRLQWLTLTRTTSVRRCQPSWRDATLICVLTVRGIILKWEGRMSAPTVISFFRSQSTQLVGGVLGGIVTVTSVATVGDLTRNKIKTLFGDVNTTSGRYYPVPSLAPQSSTRNPGETGRPMSLRRGIPRRQTRPRSPTNWSQCYDVRNGCNIL